MKPTRDFLIDAALLTVALVAFAVVYAAVRG